MKQSRTIYLIFLAVALLIVASMASCSSTKTLEGDEREAVLTYSESITDNLFAGYNDGDYAAFSKDFNSTMKKSMDQAAFNQLIGPSVKDKIGNYLSREVQTVQQTGGMVIVVYNAKFDKEDNVTLKVVIENGDNHVVSGLWFDSPKLNQK